MKKKSLGIQLVEALKGEEYLRGVCDEKRREIVNLQEANKQLQTEVRGQISAQVELSSKLFEIVRWLVNKDTAQYPFDREKNQKDGVNNYRQNGY